MVKLIRLPTFPKVDSLDADSFLKKTDEKELTKFFYDSEYLSQYSNGKKLAQAMAKFLISQEFLRLTVEESLGSGAILDLLCSNENKTLH